MSDDFDLPDTPIGMGEWLENDVEITDYADMGGFSLEDSTTELMQQEAQRQEYALRGAWMAGYRYVWVIEPDVTTQSIAQESPHGKFTVQLSRYEPRDTKPPAGIPFYDLDEVPDRVIKDAIDGNIDTSCL